MSLQDNQVHFFERLSSELGFSPAAPLIQEIMTSVNSSLSTRLICQNGSSGETLEGPFFLEKSFLVYYQIIVAYMYSGLIKIEGRDYGASKDYIRPLICEA